jgi:hypothetical protein
MCFVWISEQTAIISLHNIDWLVFFKTETMFTARYELGLYIEQKRFVFNELISIWAYNLCKRREILSRFWNYSHIQICYSTICN